MQVFKQDKNIKARIGAGVTLLLVIGLVGWWVFSNSDELFSSDKDIVEDTPTLEDKKPEGYGTFSPEFYNGIEEEKLEEERAKTIKETTVVVKDYSERGSKAYITYTKNKKEFKTELNPYTVVFDESKEEVLFPEKIKKGDKLSLFLDDDSVAKVVLKGNKLSYLEMTDILTIEGTSYILLEKDKTAIQLRDSLDSIYVDREVPLSDVKFGDGLLYALGGKVKDIPSDLEGFTIHSLSRGKLIN